MAPKYRCICTIHGCKDVIDTNTKERGTMVSSRVLRTHQQNDKRITLKKLSEDAQHRILEEQEAAIIKALQDVSINPLPMEPTFPEPKLTTYKPESSIHEPEAITHDQELKYNIDRTRRVVAHVSEIKDSTSHLLQEITIIRARTISSDHKTVQNTLQQLASIHTSTAQLERRLATISRRSKEASVKAIRNETITDLQALTNARRSLKISWEAQLQAFSERRQTELAGSAVEYDTCKHSELLLFICSSPLQQRTISKASLVAQHLSSSLLPS